MAVKFSGVQLAFLTASGNVRNGKLTIDMSLLEEAGPSRTRTSLDEKREKLHRLIDAVEANDKGVKVLTAVALHEAALPSTYMTNNANWSGVSEGSELAYEKGFSAKYQSTFDPALGGNRVQVVLTPLTDADKAKREKQRATAKAKDAAKAAESAAATAPAATAVPDGAAEATDEHGIPVEPTDESTTEPAEEEEPAVS